MKTSLFSKLIAVFSLLYLFSTNVINAQISFSFNSTYKYLKGTDAVSLPATWNTTGFNDTGWMTGDAPFHYGDGTGGTILSDMMNSYTTVYMRSTFNVTDAANIAEISMSLDFDDGFIIWINGNQALSQYAPASPTYNSRATVSRESGVMVDFKISASSLKLTEGLNTIAVQGFNTDLASTDFYFGVSMVATPLPPPLPRVDGKPVFSHSGGFYSTPFTLSITSPVPDYNIAYTLDGSNPENSPTLILAGSVANILIDPVSSVNRPVTPAVIVRASLITTGYRASFPEGRTFIFTSEVPAQKYPGGNWPVESNSGADQIIDLAVDSKVVNDPRYSSKIDFSLKSLPSISVITDLANLFDPLTGIYVNAMGHGEAWERECSVELLNPDGTPGFQANAGLRIRGGWSRHDNFPKHALRLFFNSGYGTSKLHFPLFGDEGASNFDKIDLRCEQNYSWANGMSNNNTFVREVFSRDTQRDMGEPYSRTRYYNLYLNGMFWGIYQTQERTEANFASTYFGGIDTDYDVIKVNTENFAYTVEATDGGLESWQNLWNTCSTGSFASNASYFNLEGKDASGNIMEGAPVLVDIDNLIDYMLVIFYTGNFDAPTSSYGQNKGCNNFYAIYNKTLKNQGFTFFAHDSEHSLMYAPIEAGSGLNEDRVNLARRTDYMKMEVSDFTKFHPQWLHEKLTQNAEYRLRFADKAYNYMRSGNVLSPEACLARFNSRVAQVDNAIIAESARWGDAQKSFAATRDDNWLPELDKIRTLFFPARTAILASQLTTANLLPTAKPSVIKATGVAVTSESYSILNSTTISFQNPNATGDVYYTMDNSDPRLVGGAINPTAIKWTSGSDFILSNSSSIKTRVYLPTSGNWSALNFTNILKSNEDYSALKVTEVMYHPMDAIKGIDTVFSNSLEFIEFKNTGTTYLNISGMMLDSAVHCVFPANTILAPQQFFVVASKPAAFTTFYGFPPSANFSGNLSNGGEFVLLTDPLGKKVISFTYNDKAPWPVEADGLGFSLNSVEKNPLGDPNLYTYWKASQYYNGTPFSDDFGVSVIKPDYFETSVSIFPNPTSEMLNIIVKSEKDQENLRIRIYNYGGVCRYDGTMVDEKQINLKEYGIGPGIYLVRIEGQKHLDTRKLVVTH